MRLLLDTHAFLWFIMNHPELSRSARTVIEDPANDLWLSMASIWEIAIKVRIGKLHLARPFYLFIPQQLQDNMIDALPITLPHVGAVSELPLHHRDPFDRLIVAQSLVERLPPLSADAVFDQYGVERRW